MNNTDPMKNIIRRLTKERYNFFNKHFDLGHYTYDDDAQAHFFYNDYYKTFLLTGGIGEASITGAVANAAADIAYLLADEDIEDRENIDIGSFFDGAEHTLINLKDWKEEKDSIRDYITFGERLKD